MVFELCMRTNPNYGEIRNSKGLVQYSATSSTFSPQEILKLFLYATRSDFEIFATTE